MLELLLLGIVQINLFSDGETYHFRFYDECPNYVKERNNLGTCVGFYNPLTDEIGLVKGEWMNPKSLWWVCNHEVYHKFSDDTIEEDHEWMDVHGVPRTSVCWSLTKVVFGRPPVM